MSEQKWGVIRAHDHAVGRANTVRKAAGMSWTEFLNLAAAIFDGKTHEEIIIEVHARTQSAPVGDLIAETV